MPISVQGLVKHYGKIQAVNGMSFEVRRSEVFGLLGPNGAGKTTAIECIEGLRAPDSGTVTVFGLSHGRDSEEIKSRIGVQLQSTGMYPKHKVREIISLFAALFERSLPVDDLLAMVGLTEKANAYTKNLSGGQRQRLSLALALVNDPEVVFLDEPTTGMDPQSRRGLWDIVRNLRRSGKTVLLTTHYMEEAEQLCDRVAIVDRGKVVELGSPEELISKHFKDIAIEFDLPPGVAIDILESLPGVTGVVMENGRATLYSLDVPETMAALLGLTKDKIVSLKHMTVRQATLEDVFLKITGRTMRS